MREDRRKETDMKYEDLEIEVIVFPDTDVITASPDDAGDNIT